ncbi:unnamed protein product [Echinostoma caproni]|uniref:PIPK domain-containing protein n=1 Tax=Echinostoma caproni TaxID=27848 RepID=A0A3P8JC00_9TREM|nr:unnamed protein product [Echinostoma caproni]
MVFCILPPPFDLAVYQTSESDSIPSVHSPQNSRKFLLQVPEATVQAAASAASISLSAPSGMRRFIHTLLPSNSDLKPFDEPFPPHEHPQLSLAEDLNMKRVQNASFSVHQAEANGVAARSTEYLQNLVQHLRLSTPDVYVNDRELTSIIAYALSTHEYERHLVDLHSVKTARSSAASSVQIGQSALAEPIPTPKELSGHPSPAPSMTAGRNQKQRASNLEGDACVPNSARSSVISTRSSEHHLFDSVSAKSLTSSSASTAHMNHMHKSPTNPSGTTHGQNQTVSAQVVNGGTGPAAATTERPGPSHNRHIKIQFSDSTTQFFCCVYYASEFFRLRQLLLPQGDVAFLPNRILLAPAQFTHLYFFLHLDDRFVVKELSSIEMKTFHEISKQYFDYLIGAALEQRLCVLSRILGVFHVGFKNSVTGEAHRFDVLVMENLFHDRPKLRFIYDLKGSLRKRLADEQGTFRRLNESGDPRDAAGVTVSGLDGPNGESAGMSRTYDQQRTEPGGGTENALSHCLQVDTAFLTNLFIMDYSLLVGVDPSTNQLVIGLIDYLRKFTLDKRLEMLIKQTITSAQGPMPTILTPDLYRERFLFQMDSYFPLVPDQWYDSLAEHAEAWRVTPSQPN